MTVITKGISLQTGGNCDIVDITDKVRQQLASSGVNDGIVTLFVSGSTAGITTVEFESGLLADFKGMWERIVPRDISYHHDSAWGDGNGHAHVRASLLGPSLVLPLTDGRLALGTWQQIVIVDFDNRPRSRQVVLQIVGE